MMNSHALIKFENDRLMVSGDLNFSNIMYLWKDSLPLLDRCSAWHFDLSQVGSSSSAGLALLFEWIRLSRKQNKKIHFNNIPQQLLSIAHVCSIDGFLRS
jgi:phospholipid transport system transporter-binding protein